MYEVILHLKSGKVVNIGQANESEFDLLYDAFRDCKMNKEVHCTLWLGFVFSFADVEMIEFKEVSDEN